jgi:integrase
MSYEIAQELRAERKRTRAKTDAPIFPSPPTLDDFRAAGVAFEVAKGRGRLDFHALRRTLIKIAKRAGLSLDQASLLLGHRDLRTTRKYYDEDTVNPDLGDSVERLPSLGKVRRA